MGDLAHARAVRHDGGDVGRRCARGSAADRESDGGLEGGGDATAPADCELLPDGSYLKSVRVFSFSSLPLFSFGIVRMLTLPFSLVRSVTMAQCTRAFVKGENYGFSEVGKGSQAAFA